MPPDKSNLPKGVERYRPEMWHKSFVEGYRARCVPNPDGDFVRFADLPAIIEQARQEEREKMLSEEFARRVYWKLPISQSNGLTMWQVKDALALALDAGQDRTRIRRNGMAHTDCHTLAVAEISASKPLKATSGNRYAPSPQEESRDG